MQVQVCFLSLVLSGTSRNLDQHLPCQLQACSPSYDSLGVMPAVTSSSSSPEGATAWAAGHHTSAPWDTSGSCTTLLPAGIKSDHQYHLPCPSGKPQIGRRAGVKGALWPSVSAPSHSPSPGYTHGAWGPSQGRETLPLPASPLSPSLFCLEELPTAPQSFPLTHREAGGSTELY